MLNFLPRPTRPKLSTQTACDIDFCFALRENEPLAHLFLETEYFRWFSGHSQCFGNVLRGVSAFSGHLNPLGLLSSPMALVTCGFQLLTGERTLEKPSSFISTLYSGYSDDPCHPWTHSKLDSQCKGRPGHLHVEKAELGIAIFSVWTSVLLCTSWEQW